MKFVFVPSTISLLIATGSMAFAGEHSLSLGYAQSKVENFKNMPGVNIQYRYEWDFTLSALVSFTALQNDMTYSSNGWLGQTNDHTNAEYYSLMAGPAYRFNKYVSSYVLLGVSHSKMERHYTRRWFGTESNIDYSNNDNAFAYGAGIIVNVSQHLTINVGYEGSQTKVENQHRSVNGINIGAGYHF